MHLTLLTLLATGSSAQFVPQVAHAYGLEVPGEWHPINGHPINQHQNQHQHQHQHLHSAHHAAHHATPTPSTMMSMAKPSIRPVSMSKDSIKPMSSSMPYISGMFASASQSYPYSHAHHSYGYGSQHATSTPHAYMATPTARPSHALQQHQYQQQATPSHPSHGTALVPNGHMGTPPGGMGIPPSAERPKPLYAGEVSKAAGAQGDIAPVAPLPPGSNVAPVQPHDKFGADEGNSFCLGQCYSSAEEAQCGPPYVSIPS